MSEVGVEQAQRRLTGTSKVYVSPRRKICTAVPGAASFAMVMNSSNEVIFVRSHHSGGSAAGGRLESPRANSKAVYYPGK